jgi:hypothetical protein
MPVHHGGKVGQAGKTLVTKSSGKSAKQERHWSTTKTAIIEIDINMGFW